MEIDNPVRVLKGQELLPNHNTLKECGFPDGSTVNIIVEPDKQINIILKLGPKRIHYSVNPSLRTRELKKQLVDGGVVGFASEEMALRLSTDNNATISADTWLSEDSLPLHLHGVSDNTVITVEGGIIMVKLVSQSGGVMYKTFRSNITIDQMKNIIQSHSSFFDNGFLADIWLFRQVGISYIKIDGDSCAPIGAKIKNNDVIHLLQNKFYQEDSLISVYMGRSLIGRVGRNERDTVLAVKLRVQGQFGHPVSSIDVESAGLSYSYANIEKCPDSPTVYVKN